MTNFEKHRERMLEIANTTDTRIAVCNGILYPCEDVICENCDFYHGHGGGSCDRKFILWLCQEYQEKPKITERFYHFLKSLPKSARIKYSRGFLYINVVDKTNSIYCADSVFLPKLPSLEEAAWYEVSEMLEWEVEE